MKFFKANKGFRDGKVDTSLYLCAKKNAKKKLDSFRSLLSEVAELEIKASNFTSAPYKIN